MISNISNGESGASVRTKLNEAIDEVNFLTTKNSSIVGGTTIDLSTATGTLVHITGSGWNCTSFGTCDEAKEFTLIFDGDGTITYNATSLKLPNAMNISVADGDMAVFITDTAGNWQLKSFLIYDDVWTPFASTVGGFSVLPTGLTFRYKANGKTCTMSFNSTGNGTSNANVITFTIPFNAAQLSVNALTFCSDSGGATYATAITTAGSNIVNVYKQGSSVWPTSGNKRFNGTITFEI